MNGRRRILLLLVLMLGVALCAAGITLHVLYQTALDQQRDRLIETAQSQARLFEAMARFDRENYGATHTPEETFAATLSQMEEAHEQLRGFGDTGEFTFARLEGDQIVFLLSHRHDDMDDLKPVPLDSDLAEPMRRALSGESGTIIGLDYRGETVLAAYEPVAEYDLGIVAKIDLAEIRAPFIRAGLLAGVGGLAVVLVGTLLFLVISNPLLFQLEAREVKYRTLFENANDAIFIVDPETGRVLDANENAARRLGYTKDELLHMNIRDINPPHAAERNAAIIAELQARGSIVFEHVHRHKDGTEIPVEISSRVITYNGKPVFQSMVRDITERKRAEQALQTSQHQLQSLFDHANDAILIADNTGRYIEVNEAACKLTGYTREELLRLTVRDITPPEYHARWDDLWGEFLTAGQQRGEYPILRKDGTQVHVDYRATAHIVPGQHLSILRDVTARKAAEAALRTNEARFRAASEGSLQAFFILKCVHGEDGTVIDFTFEHVNARGAAMVRMAVVDMLGQRLCDLFPHNRTGSFFDKYVRVWQTQQPLDEESVLPSDYGIPGWYHHQIVPLDDGIAISAQNITARKNAEEELAWSARSNASLAALSEHLLTLSTIDDMSAEVLRHARDLTGSEFGYVGHIDPQTGALVCTTMTRDVWDHCDVPDKRLVFEKFDGLWGWVLDHKQPLLTNDPAHDPRSSGTPEGHLPIKRFLSVPALIGQELVGQIALANAPQDYTPRDLDLLQRLATIYALAVHAKRTADRLRFQAQLLGSVRESVVATDLEGNVIYWGPGAEALYGYQADEMLGESLTVIVEPQDRDAELARMAQVREQGYWSGQFRQRRKDGTPFWADTRIGLATDEQDAPFGLIGVDRDITDQVEVIQALRDREAQFSGVIEHSYDGIRLVDATGTVIAWNRASEVLTGLSRDKVLGRKIWDVEYDLTPPDQRTPGLTASMQARIMKLLQQGDDESDLTRELHEREIITADGTRKTIQWLLFAIPHGGQFLLCNITRDVTDQRRTETAEREQRALVEALRAAAVALSSSLDLDTVLEHILAGIVQVFEPDAADVMLIQDGVARVVRHWGYAERDLAEQMDNTALDVQRVPILRNLVRYGQPIVIPDTHTSRDYLTLPTSAWVRSHIAAPIVLAGETIGILNINSATPNSFQPEHAHQLRAFAEQVSAAVRNAQLYQQARQEIAERLQVELALRVSESRYRGIVQDQTEMICRYVPDGTLTFVNDAYCEYMGHTREDLLGTSLMQRLDEPVRQRVQAAIASLTPQNPTVTHEYTTIIRGAPRLEQWTDRAIFNEDGQVIEYQGVGRDITDLRQAQEQRLQLRLEQERMRMLTSFVEAASHEFRTPLAVIHSGLEVLERMAEIDAQFQPWISRVKEYALYLGELIDVTLTMSRLDSGVQIATEPLHVHEILFDLQSSFARDVEAKGQTLEVEQAKALPLVRADAFDLHMALSNILQNAVQFTPEGGTITVRTWHTDDDVVIEIADTGIGISAEHLPHIFERFYRVDRARTARYAGMGLAIAQRVIQLHDGRVEVESTPGKGSAFRVILPAEGL